MKKYPNGTLQRWEIIAEQMNRSVQEVTFMAARVKENIYRPSESVAEAIVQDATKKVKKVAAPVEQKSSDSLWSQEQQKLLENAIVKHPKSTVGDRWQKISNSVPGKTKEECLARYKYLVEKVKAQKQKESSEPQQQQEENNAQAQQQQDDAEAINPNENNDNNVHNAQDDETSNVMPVEEDDEPEPIKEKKGGKPRNKRKERKKRMEFSSGEDDYDD